MPSYLTIVQDPYPPLNNSPDFYEVAGGVAFNHNQMNFIDCIDMNDFENSLARGISDIKKEDLFNTSDNMLNFQSPNIIKLLTYKIFIKYNWL